MSRQGAPETLCRDGARARDVMWSQALAAHARTDCFRRDVFQPTATGWEPPIDELETETGCSSS
jgi:hypothetical protein